MPRLSNQILALLAQCYEKGWLFSPPRATLQLPPDGRRARGRWFQGEPGDDVTQRTTASQRASLSRTVARAVANGWLVHDTKGRGRGALGLTAAGRARLDAEVARYGSIEALRDAIGRPRQTYTEWAARHGHDTPKGKAQLAALLKDLGPRRRGR